MARQRAEHTNPENVATTPPSKRPAKSSGDLKCPICGKEGLTPRGLHLHTLRIHKGEQDTQQGMFGAEGAAREAPSNTTDHAGNGAAGIPEIPAPDAPKKPSRYALPIGCDVDRGDEAEGDADNGAAADGEVGISASDFATPEDESSREVADDFDSLESLALPQDFNPGILEEDPPVTVRRPSPWDFFRVNPDPAMSLSVGIVEIADERDAPYLVVPAMYPVFGKLVSRRQLFVCKTSLMGPTAVFLWAARLPQDNRRRGGGLYNETALKAAERAKSKWTKIQSDEALKCYRIFGPREPIDEPLWPNTTLLELLRKGFGDGYLVKSSDHPLVRRYMGSQK